MTAPAGLASGHSLRWKDYTVGSSGGVQYGFKFSSTALSTEVKCGDTSLGYVTMAGTETTELKVEIPVVAGTVTNEPVCPKGTVVSAIVKQATTAIPVDENIPTVNMGCYACTTTDGLICRQRARRLRSHLSSNRWK